MAKACFNEHPSVVHNVRRLRVRFLIWQATLLLDKQCGYFGWPVDRLLVESKIEREYIASYERRASKIGGNFNLQS